MSHEHRAAHQKLDRAMVAQKAAELWGTFSDNEQRLVRFGLFPADKMAAAQVELVDAGCDQEEVGRLLSVALMEVAESRGGMIA